MSIKQREKTRRKLITAITELCDEKNYFDITISDICKKADIHRTSFYRYYECKDDLLIDIENLYVNELESLSKNWFHYKFSSLNQDARNYEEDLKKVWDYSYENRKAFKFLLSPNGDFHFAYKFKNLLTKVYITLLSQNNLSFGENQDYVIEFLVSGIIAIQYKFVSQEKLTYEDLQNFVNKMCLHIPLENFGEKK